LIMDHGPWTMVHGHLKWAANIGGKRNFQVILHKILPPLHEDTCKAGGYCRSEFCF
jgi:hypothetical protein